MVLFNALLILNLAHFGLAISLDSLETRKTFSLEQVAVKRSNPWSSAWSVRRAHLKYGISVPPQIEEAADKDAGVGKGTAAARPVRMDQMYVVPVQVGKSSLLLDIDTGSSDL
jgi:aspergillopepsin I